MMVLHVKSKRAVVLKVSSEVNFGSHGIRDQFPGDPQIHFCNGYFKVHLFSN